MLEMMGRGGLVEPTKGFEPSTYSLRYCRSTVELGRHIIVMMCFCNVVGLYRPEGDPLGLS